MNGKTFETLRRIVYENSGITLNDTKVAMVASRIAKRMRVLGLDSYESYLRLLTEDTDRTEITRFLDVISTNVTSFFREPDHFDFFGTQVADWVEAGRSTIRVWSAASSTGEEPYSIAMTMRTSAGSRFPDMKVLATDISTNVLAAAQAGEYDQAHVEKIPSPLRRRFFTEAMSGDGRKCYRVTDDIRRMVLYRRLNLSRPPFPMKGDIDVVFCRNVMIYFDDETRTRLVDEVFRLLRPGGYLLTGHAESLTSLRTPFQCLRPSIYQKPE